MSSSDTPVFRTGQIVPLRFRRRQFSVIVIDPDGLGSGKPSIGMGLRAMQRHTNVPAPTISRRVLQNLGGGVLELPSGKTFQVFQIYAEDGNSYQVIEATDWVELAKDWAMNPGKLRKPARDGLIEFLAWFAAEGIYAQAYTFLKRTYTDSDNESLYRWRVSRESGKPHRKDWSWEVKGKDPQGRYGYWTNYVYRGLFGMDAAEMKQVWESPVSGSAKVARNYIPESVGLEAVAYCEKLVAALDMASIHEAHDEAIRLTKAKYRRYLPRI